MKRLTHCAGSIAATIESCMGALPAVVVSGGRGGGDEEREEDEEGWSHC